MPDALAATLLSYKTVPTRKVFQMTLELPIEQASQAIALFGKADPDGATWLAVARLAARVPANPEPVAEPEKATGGGVAFKDRPRSQQAGIRCKDDPFQIWLAETYPALWDKHYYAEVGNLTGSAIATADLTLKEILGISSKSELDEPKSPKALAWDRLLTDFDMRNTVR